MVQTLEAIKGGGGSIKVGTMGTIGSLMTRELESISASQKPSFLKNKQQTVPVSVPCGATTPKRLQPRKSLDEASSSRSSNNNLNDRSLEILSRTRKYPKNTHQIPMLGSGNISFDRTPSRVKTERKGPNIVEIVDIKCGNPDRAWATPITNRLRKLGFSKLSESIA